MNPPSRTGPGEVIRAGRSARTAFSRLVAAGAVAACVACSSVPSGGASEPSASSADATVLVGWLHTVMNGAPTHYLLIAADSTVQLLLDETTAQPPGAPFSLDGRRVEAEGVLVGPDRMRVRVLRAARGEGW